MKRTKSANPYAKKHAKRLHITRKQWIRILCIGAVIALVVGLAVITRAGLNEVGDEHAGHNHGDSAATDNGHYEGDGHNHGNSAATGTGKLRYQTYNSADGHGIGIYNSKNELLLEKKGMPFAPIRQKEGDLTLVYFTISRNGFTNGVSIYCDDEGQRVSDAFHGVLATDGTRVAYCSDDDTTIIVQDLFDKKAYYKEYPLPGVFQNGDQTIQNGKVSSDKKSVTVTYVTDEKGNPRNYSIKLYE